MFVGEYFRTLDKKGRIFIPSDYRDELIKGGIIAKGYDNVCLFLFSINEWNKLIEVIQSGNHFKIDKFRFERWFFSSANKINVDPQGRINIPSELIKHAKLDREVALVGVSNRIEIWDKELWESYYKEAEAKFLSEGSAIKELGF